MVDDAGGSARWLRGLQLALATIWLLDGVLQLHPFMFTPGADGFSGMISATSKGNPSWVAHSITWNANFVDHHATVANGCFALIQILIGLGIAWRPTVKVALAASIVWSLGVWWMGEGLGGVLHGDGTPLAGGPGAVLFYAMLAVLLWPPRDARRPVAFAAAATIGEVAAKALWSCTWVLLAVLALLGAGRAANEAQVVVLGVDSGQPGWLAVIDRHAASLVAGDGLLVAVVFAVLAVLFAVGVLLGGAYARVVVALAVGVGIVLWVVAQNFGMILAGGATDPNSGPLIVLLAITYWPISSARRAMPDVVPATALAGAA